MESMSPAAQSVATPATHGGDVVRALRDDGSVDPAVDPRLDDEEVVALYRAMVRARRVDDKLAELQRAGRIGFHAGARGEEAAIIGAVAALRERDWVFPASREAAAALYRGVSLATYVHHMFGDARDEARGRQMPDHLFSRTARVVSSSSATGTQIAHAVGFAWGAKIRKEDLVALAFFGDGATSSADFHNGLNFAGVFKAPAVLFCRNNGWALSMPASRQTASASLAVKGVAYGVPFVRVDGCDVLAVLEVTRQAVARAARGEGATLVEAIVVRDLEPDGEAFDVRAPSVDSRPYGARDPLALARRHLEARGLFGEAQQAQLDAGIDAEIGAAIVEAEAEGPPPRETMFHDVYAGVPAHLREQAEVK
jgi:2-oxoisovalerate dehydrogenase E1 component alpha subunit